MNFKTRISLNYLLVTALLLAVVFVVIYYIVNASIFYYLDSNLKTEAYKHLAEVELTEDGLQFRNKKEWEEREHRETEVNPVFIQLMDLHYQIEDRSPNLKTDTMQFFGYMASGESYNALLHHKPIRQMQVAFEKNGQLQGFIISGISMSAQLHTLEKLRHTLFILYPTLLVILFLISRYLAGKSIRPITEIIATTDRISKNNLSERVTLPENRDELYDLSSSINHLLERIESAWKREQQFTSDASHELRTPLAVLKGTLEVLIRKERTAEEYKDKVKFALSEIDHMGRLIEQLLTMARMEQEEISAVQKSLSEILVDLLDRNQFALDQKNIIVNKSFSSTFTEVNEQLAKLVFGNILSNAIKYSPENGVIQIGSEVQSNGIMISISDEGSGIEKEELDLIFNPFYRSIQQPKTKGSGLGLSIALKAAARLNAEIFYSANEPKGSVFHVFIRQN